MAFEFRFEFSQPPPRVSIGEAKKIVLDMNLGNKIENKVLNWLYRRYFSGFGFDNLKEAYAAISEKIENIILEELLEVFNLEIKRKDNFYGIARDETLIPEENKNIDGYEETLPIEIYGLINNNELIKYIGKIGETIYLDELGIIAEIKENEKEKIRKASLITINSIYRKKLEARINAQKDRKSRLEEIVKQLEPEIGKAELVHLATIEVFLYVGNKWGVAKIENRYWNDRKFEDEETKKRKRFIKHAINNHPVLNHHLKGRVYRTKVVNGTLLPNNQEIIIYVPPTILSCDPKTQLVDREGKVLTEGKDIKFKHPYYLVDLGEEQKLLKYDERRDKVIFLAKAPKIELWKDCYYIISFNKPNQQQLYRDEKIICIAEKIKINDETLEMKNYRIIDSEFAKERNIEVEGIFEFITF